MSLSLMRSFIVLFSSKKKQDFYTFFTPQLCRGKKRDIFDRGQIDPSKSNQPGDRKRSDMGQIRHCSSPKTRCRGLPSQQISFPGEQYLLVAHISPSPDPGPSLAYWETLCCFGIGELRSVSLSCNLP
jgi:hypothetical protein